MEFQPFTFNNECLLMWRAAIHFYIIFFYHQMTNFSHNQSFCVIDPV